MKKKIKYTDEEMGDLKVIDDFLPKPENLVLKEKTVKITLILTEKSVLFFKNQAEAHHTQYQKMIRALLDQYVTHASKSKKHHLKKNRHE